MCDCLKKFEERFLQRYPTWKGKPVRRVDLPQGLNFETGKLFYYLPIYVDVGQKKPNETHLIMSRCPICGEKFESSQPEPAKTRYVVGFAFTPDLEHVLLLEKTHPEWQRGKWNGIGGKIEEGESPLSAMIREATEETRVASDFGWSHYATMIGDDFEVYVFAGTISEPPALYADSGERLTFCKLPLGKLPRLANLDFLIEAALVRDSFRHMNVIYGKNGATGQTI